MNWSKIAKYASGGLLVASMFALVMMGKVTANDYSQLVMAVLTALGIYHAAKS